MPQEMTPPGFSLPARGDACGSESGARNRRGWGDRHNVCSRPARVACDTRFPSGRHERATASSKDRSMSGRVSLAGFAWPFAVFALVTTPAAQRNPQSLPERLDSYIKKGAQLTSAEQTQLLAGQPVTRMLDADPSHEVAVLGAVWVAAPAERYIAAVRDIEQFEKGESFLVTEEVSSPPRLEDFAALRIPSDDVDDLKSCKVGSCQLKLGEE